MIAVVLLALVFSTPESPGEPLSPEALGAPPQVNSLPTAWACTVETLRAGRECIFESESSPASTDVKGQSSGNVRTLADIGPALCSQVARPPSGVTAAKELVAQCERRFSAAAEDFCGLEGKVPVIDAKGRFTPTARTCYRQLSLVLQDISMMATVASACCQCAQKQGCPGSGDRCHENVSHQELGENALVCMAHQCGAACDLLVPAASVSREPGRGEPRSHRAPQAGSSL